jgi:hypothetical protein
MDKFLEFVVDYVFSFGTLCLILIGVFIWAMAGVLERDKINRENYKLAVEACYSQGMVLVDTDAGRRCVSPQSLVKVK